MFWRGVTFLEGCLQYFGGCGIFGEVLAMFLGMWHFGGACSVLEGVAFWKGVFLRDVTFLRQCLQCFRGVWHF